MNLDITGYQNLGDHTGVGEVIPKILDNAKPHCGIEE
jgi:hypothetical protein